MDVRFDLFTAVLLDVSVWLVCLALLIRFARLSITHPATVYLAFHAFVVTFRAVAILSGAQTLFTHWSRAFEPVTQVEIARAVLLEELALIVMTVAWITAARRSLRADYLAGRNSVAPGRKLRIEIIQTVCMVALPVGGLALLYWGHVPGMVRHEIVRDWATSSWPLELQSWAGLGLLALLYWYGFRPAITIPLALYLGLMAYQGFHRFRVLIPIILMVQIYCDRKNVRFPPIFSSLLVACTVLLFFPLKEIAQGTQQGQPVRQILHSAHTSVNDALSGINPDQMVLDQFAATLTLADRHHKRFWGTTYLGLLTLPVPRQMWAEKPGLADFEKEISTRSRPMAENGMVVTLLGESYLNFSYVGVVLVPFMVAYVTGSWFANAYRQDYFTVRRFIYLIVSSNLLMVYRDGLTSLFVFPIVNSMPLVAIAALHLLYPRRPHVRIPMIATPRVRLRSTSGSADASHSPLLHD